MTIIKKLVFIGVLGWVYMVSINAQTDCPSDKVCLTPEAARAALVAGDTVKAQVIELAAKDKAIADIKDELNNMRVRFAEISGEATALRQNAVSDRAIIDILLKSAKKKCLPFSVCLF